MKHARRLPARRIARPRAYPLKWGQRGAVALMFGLMLLMLISFMGMVIDLGRAYDRRGELQAIADVAALSGARSLNGLASGINAVVPANGVGGGAVPQAKLRAGALKYNFRSAVVLPDAAISFASTPNAAAGTWKTPAQAAVAPAGLYFMRIDAAALTAADGTPYGRVEAFFMRALAPELGQITVSAHAVAGRYNGSGPVLLYQ